MELFFVKDGLPLQRYEILKDAITFSGVERILDNRYYETVGANSRSFLHAKDNENFPAPSSPHTRREETKGIAVSPSLDARGYGEGEKIFSDGHILTDIEMGEMEIVLSWVEANKDQVNYINMDTVSGKEACLKLLKDYLHDEETFQKKHFRWL